HIALIGGGVVGCILAIVVYFISQRGGASAGHFVASLLNMAVFGAVISYAMQCASFIFLRRRLPNIERPYRSPVGVWCAGIAGVIALVSLVSLYTNPLYVWGVVGTLVYFLLGVAYFAVVGRHRLVLSPEEEFALTAGQHGDPAAQGYGKTSLSDIKAGG